MATRRLLVEIVGDDASLQRSLKSSATTTEKFGASIARTGLSMVKAFAPAIAAFAAADFAKGAIEGAEHLKLAQESLTAAIEHTGGNAAKLMAQYTATAKAAAQFGITQTDATRGLAKATLLTGNAAAAQRAYEEALVISKATGKDFNTVLVATSKGQEGITTSLRRYGVLVDSTASGQEQFNTVMARFGGQAEANTSASDKLRASFSNLQTNLGTLLLPTFNKIVEAINRFVQWLQSPQVSAAIHRFGDTMRKVFEDIKRVVVAAWPYIKATIKNALEVIRGIIDVITGLIHGDWSRVWKGITEIVGGALKQIWNNLKTYIKILGAVASAVGHAIWNGIKAGATAVINWVIGQLNHLVDAYNQVLGWLTGNIAAIPTIGGNSGNSGGPTGTGRGGPVGVPAHAMGGIFTRPHLAWIAERGPEAVVPLTGPNRGLGFGGVVINMNGTYIGGKRQLEEEIVNGLSRWARRNGNSSLRNVLGAA